jgi:hypothetical protein
MRNKNGYESIFDEDWGDDWEVKEGHDWVLIGVCLLIVVVGLGALKAIY